MHRIDAVELLLFLFYVTVTTVSMVYLGIEEEIGETNLYINEYEEVSNVWRYGLKQFGVFNVMTLVTVILGLGLIRTMFKPLSWFRTWAGETSMADENHISTFVSHLHWALTMITVGILIGIREVYLLLTLGALTTVPITIGYIMASTTAMRENMPSRDREVTAKGAGTLIVMMMVIGLPFAVVLLVTISQLIRVSDNDVPEWITRLSATQIGLYALTQFCSVYFFITNTSKYESLNDKRDDKRDLMIPMHANDLIGFASASVLFFVTFYGIRDESNL